jgi:enoyl reductase-like protein
MDKIDKYLQYVIAKYFIFQKEILPLTLNLIDLESMTIVDINILKKNLPLPKKVSDKTMIELTKNLLETFSCFHIDDLQNKISKNNDATIYNHYKKYKVSNNTTKETETYLKLHMNTTQKVKPINKTIDITNQIKKLLQLTYGNQINTNAINTNAIMSSEYKFEFITGGKIYTFCLISSGESNSNTWKLESNTTKGDIHDSFIQFLYKSIECNVIEGNAIESEKNIHGEDCC